MFFLQHPRTLVAALILGLGLFGGTAAVAAPVFDGAGLSEDAVSPNGDNVQDFTVIEYTVLADSADVRVQLTPLGGGVVVGVLEPFSRRGAGLHTLVFAGTVGGLPVTDGSYQVEVLGIGSQGEGTEQIDLPLVVDRVAPAIASWDLVSTTSVLQNGDTVTLQACVDSDAQTVAVDLSGLDSGWNPAAVNEVLIPPDCRQFTYTITAGNTLPDLKDSVAVVIATDAAGNSSTRKLELCLSNNPPSIVSAVLLNVSPFFQNGDEIQVEVTVDAPGAVTATGDFSNLDSNFNPGAVVSTDLGNQRFEVRYRVTDTNTRNDGDYPLKIIVEDQGCGTAIDLSLTVTLDNAGENSSLLENVFLSSSAFSPRGNGSKTVNINFTTLEDSLLIAASVVADLINPNSRETVVIQTLTLTGKGPQTLVWDGSGIVANHTPDRLEDQKANIVLRAVSLSLDRQRSENIPLEIDNLAPQITKFPPVGSVAARNGRQVNIPVSYDQPGDTFIVDFSNLDSNFNPGTSSVATPDSGDGRYGIFYTVSATNTVQDTTGIPVPITAYDRAGNFAQTDLVTVCLSNRPPVFDRQATRFLGSPGPFKGGARIAFETTWTTEDALPLVVTADFSAVDTTFDAVDRPATVLDRGNNVFEISYTLSSTTGRVEATRLPVYVTARDNPEEGCGATTVEAVYVDFDARQGPQPTLSAATQATTQATVALFGRAADAVKVQIQRSTTAVDTFAVNPDSTFAGSVNLFPGSNTFTARGIDGAGNISPASRPVEVFRSEGTLFDVPHRFGPGDEFFFALPTATTRITLRVFNLEGTEIQRLDGGGGTLIRIPWDGRDNTGNLSSSGPYLAVAEVYDGGSLRERLRKAFVFTRRGVEP